MTTLDVARRLRSWEAGEPLPRYQTLHHAIGKEEDTLVVAFVRMAGESRPWGIAWGHPGEEPRIESVADGRVRDDVAAICADFGEDLLEHLRVQNWSYDPIPKKAPSEDLCQLWVPNRQHVAMFHQLAYAYSQTKFGGDDVETLNALGRLSGWLFRESSRRGSQHLIDASAALREAFAFPAQDARQAHLGYLLAWLTTTGDRTARLAAAEVAESSAVSPTMNPALERDALAEPLERRRKIQREGRSAAAEETEISEVLADELSRRWELCCAAYDLLAADSRDTNPGVADLITESLKEFYWQCQAPELKLSDPAQGTPFISHPETDFHGSSAASRYLSFASADEGYINALIHDDDELLAEALRDGHAVICEVLEVRNEGKGRTTTPVWTVRLAEASVQRIREGGRVTPRGSRGHQATIRSVDQDEEGTTLELEWIGRKTMPLEDGIGVRPLDEEWVGEEVYFVASDAAGLTQWRSQRVWSAKDGPGAWLTHGQPPPPMLADIANDTPEVIVDDIPQIEGDGA